MSTKSVILLCLFAFLFGFLFSQPVLAQLGPTNEKGVAIGHVHLMVRNPEAHKKLWVDIFDAKVAYAGKLEMLKLPGTIILLAKGTPADSGLPTVDHFALLVRDLAAVKKKLASANIPLSDDSIATFPDGVRVELIEDKGLAVPVAFGHFHIFTDDTEMILNWYQNHFGIRFLSAPNFPGGEMRFTAQANPKRVPTKGYLIDHISFEVKGLEEFCKKLEAQGIKLDMPIVNAPSIALKVTFVTDPIGTRIELTEGLADK